MGAGGYYGAMRVAVTQIVSAPLLYGISSGTDLIDI